VVAPAGIVSNGFPAVQAKCGELGIRFRWWQQAVGRLILSKRADGKYAATIGGTGLSIPRQVGKTFLVASIVFALCLLRPGLTVIWTSHRLRTAEETFKKLQGFARRSKIKPHVLKVILGSGEEEILFRNGSRIMFGARERGFGRGFDEVDVVIYDEAQILGEAALDDIVPATNQCRQDTGALLLFMGTPPKPDDKGEVFSRMRREALSGGDTDTGWVEFGADPDYTPPPPTVKLASADWAQVAKANPSYPDDTPAEAILRMRKQLGPDSFPREGLGIWDDDSLTTIPLRTWNSCGDAAGRIVGKVILSVDMSLDRTRTVIGVCGQREDGRRQVEIAAARPGTAWVAEALKEASALWDAPVMVASTAASPAAALIPDLIDAGLDVVPVSGTELAQACGHLLDSVIERKITHLADDALTAAVAGAEKKPGEAYVFTRKGDTDISPLYAITLALWGWTTRHASGDILQAVW
jgi:hypothetical protein